MTWRAPLVVRSISILQFLSLYYTTVYYRLCSRLLQITFADCTVTYLLIFYYIILHNTLCLTDTQNLITFPFNWRGRDYTLTWQLQLCQSRLFNQYFSPRNPKRTIPPASPAIPGDMLPRALSCFERRSKRRQLRSLQWRT